MIKRIIFCAIILSAASQFVCAATLGSISSTTIMGSATVSIPGPTYSMSALIDNFDDGANPNNLGGQYNQLNIGSGRVVAISYDTNTYVGASGASLRVAYNTPNSGDWDGMTVTLAPSAGSRDVSSYKSLNFDIKGVDLYQSFKIELDNADSTAIKSALYFTDYEDTGTSVNDWTHVVIPLDAFANFPDTNSLTNLQYIQFIFEHDYQSTTSGLLHASTIYIDNLAFGTTQQDVVRVDHFGDNYGPDALGGNVGTTGTGDTAATYSATEYHNYSRAIKIDYDVSTSNPGWSGCFMQFGSGTDGITARSHNFSAYNKVRLTVKSENGSTPPDKISIQLVDSNAQYSLNLPSGFGGTPISSSTWTTYETNLSNFSGLDKSSIKQMNIIFEYGTPGVLPSVGTVYFDEIDFAQ